MHETLKGNADSIAVMGFALLLAIVIPVVSAEEVKICGQVSNVDTVSTIWDFKNFAGFYYDIDKNIGTEKVTFNVTAVDAAKTTATLSDREGWKGIIYQTTAQPKNFKFKPWGSYQILAFLGKPYFAAYNADTTQKMIQAGENTAPYLYVKSKNRNLMTYEQLGSILIDSATETLITPDAPLKLEEGYELALKYVNGTQALLELTKGDQLVDTNIIQPSIAGATMDDKTYYYKKDLGDTKEIVILAVHFKNCIHGPDKDRATIDGIFQISDTPLPIELDQRYGKMSIRNVDPGAFTIVMDNKDNLVSLRKNKNTQLMQNLYIRTADQDATATDPLRYYIYKNYTEPGTYEIRGTVTDLGAYSFTWNPMTFAALYYDIDKNIGNEQIYITLTNIDGAKSTATLSDQEGARGIIYNTTAQNKNFKFKPWGSYKKMGFRAEPYFAAYNNDVTAGMMAAKETVPFIADKSMNDNLMTDEQLSSILIDSATETIITSDAPLKLEEGYELALKYVNGTQALLELTKDDQLVDTKIIQPSIAGATMGDKTYYYRRNLGDTEDIVILAVHFKNCIQGPDKASATVDAIFQISDTPVPIKVGQQYGKMSIRYVDPSAFTITMDNKDNQVTLSKNRDIPLMDKIHIKTGNQDDISAANPLRYYIYSEGTSQYG